VSFLFHLASLYYYSSPHLLVFFFGFFNFKKMSTIWLSTTEYNCALPRLFNSTRRRKRDITNFVAPEQMRNTVVRSIEFPNGVFVNAYGEVEPNHTKSGIYRCRDPTCQRENTGQTRETSPVQETPLEKTDDEPPTKSRLIKRLRRGVASVNRDFKRQCRQRESYTSLRKYIDRVQELEDEWRSIRREHPGMSMVYDSDQSSQTCDFTFTLEKRILLKVRFNMRASAWFCLGCDETRIGKTMTEVCRHAREKHSNNEQDAALTMMQLYKNTHED
jgi:hypothetical protein